MPGMFGSVGAAAVAAALEAAFRERWGSAVVLKQGDSVLGAHAFGGIDAVYASGSELVGVDGEWGLYREASSASAGAPGRGRSIHQSDGDGFRTRTASAGNVAVFGDSGRALHLAVDATGTFPLYFASVEGGLAFSSLLKPLSAALNSLPDRNAMLEFLRQGYIVGNKTMFAGIYRMLPGQVLSFRAGMAPRIRETSTAWTTARHVDAEGAAEVAWEELQQAVQRGLSPDGSALMMSGGWDSRTLLAAITRAGVPLRCYSHGDVGGRELQLVRRLCDSAHRPCHLEPIDDRVLDVAALSAGFGRVENVIFPHWHRAGRILGESAPCVAAGVFGEILGGHYGPAMVAGTGGKIASIASLLMGRDATSLGPDSRTAAEFLRVGHLGKHWYLDPHFEDSIDRPLENINAAIDEERGRLERRGVTGALRQVEAFISEHRGTQYINMQILSCRAATDVSLPFAGAEMFEYSTQVPLTAKVHNSLNRIMLARHAPELLAHPMAATLLPARSPIWAQEASRLVRKIYEDGGHALERRTRGRVRAPRLGWVNFDFLRKGDALRSVVDDLRCDFWNREAMYGYVASIADPSNNLNPHSLYDQLMKVYTVDHMVR